MTLNDGLALTERRLSSDPEDVIDVEWVEDWKSLDRAALVSQKFLSIASFADYRSKLNYSEDWKSRPDLGIDFDSHRATPDPTLGFVQLYENSVGHTFQDALSLPPTDSIITPQFLSDLPHWMREQDWYDYSEWHDHLEP